MAKTLKRTDQGQADAAFLENLVNNPHIKATDNNNGGQEVDNDELKQIADNAAQKLNKTVEDTNKPTDERKKAEETQKEIERLKKQSAALQQKIDDQKKNDADAEIREKNRQEEKQQREHDKDLRDQKAAADRKAKQLSQAQGVAGDLFDKVGNAMDAPIQKVGHAVDLLAAAKTPGGIGFLVVLLIFLLFVIVRVNQKGDTRIKQFWYMLNGKAHMDKTLIPDGVGTLQNGASTVPFDQSLAQKAGQEAGKIANELQKSIVIQEIPSAVNGVIAGIEKAIGLDFAPPDTFRVGAPS